jgi:hypothetical protein
MTPEQNLASGRDGEHGSLLVLGGLALIIGAVSGFVGALFLLLLERAASFRGAVIVWAHSKGFAGFLIVSIACAAGAGGAAWLVRRYSPHASGSGIPHVMKVQYVEHVPPDVAAAKFWLLNRRRGQWSDTSRHELTGANGGGIEISERSNLDRARRIAYILSQAAATKTEP